MIKPNKWSVAYRGCKYWSFDPDRRCDCFQKAWGRIISYKWYKHHVPGEGYFEHYLYASLNSFQQLINEQQERYNEVCR